jgi:hypothetical protein
VPSPVRAASLARFSNMRAVCARCGARWEIRIHFDRDCALVRGDHFHRVCRCGNRVGGARLSGRRVRATDVASICESLMRRFCIARCSETVAGVNRFNGRTVDGRPRHRFTRENPNSAGVARHAPPRPRERIANYELVVRHRRVPGRVAATPTGDPRSLDSSLCTQRAGRMRGCRRGSALGMSVYRIRWLSVDRRGGVGALTRGVRRRPPPLSECHEWVEQASGGAVQVARHRRLFLFRSASSSAARTKS